MDHDFMLAEFFGRIQRNSPALIVLVLCAMMMLAQRRRHPRAALWAALAFAWLLFTDLLAIGWYTAGIFFVFAKIPHPREVEAFGETILSCFEALGYILFLFALSAARTPYRPSEYYDDLGEDNEHPRGSQDGASAIEAPQRPQENQRNEN
jgi:hypothetical protein